MRPLHFNVGWSLFWFLAVVIHYILTNPHPK